MYMKCKRGQSEELQPALRGEVTAVTAFNPCGSLLCLEKVHYHTLLLCYKAVAPGRSTKKKERKNPKPVQLDVPYGYGCENGWILSFSLHQFKQSSLKKPISKCSWTAGQVFGQQPQIRWSCAAAQESS